jgi:hypothetical protein
MSLSDPLTIITILLAVAVLGLGAGVIVLALRLRSLAADQRRAFEGGEVDVIATLARHRRRLEELGAELGEMRGHTSDVEAKAARGLNRVGVVRYDAFDDIGGELSFSTALLDDHADGVVLTSITSRAGGRTYLKIITGGTGGEGASLLSDEETAAVAAAHEELRGERVVAQGKRRWRQR